MAMAIGYMVISYMAINYGDWVWLVAMVIGIGY
jgi:hypothetical protein